MASPEALTDGVRAASRFIGRLSVLDAEAILVVAAAWHDVMRVKSAAWLAAEEAIARTVRTSGRRESEKVLLGQLTDSVSARIWYGHPPSPRVNALHGRSAAKHTSAAHVAAVAMLALLVRDQLDEAQFALLYQPFDRVIPAD